MTDETISASALMKVDTPQSEISQGGPKLYATVEITFETETEPGLILVGLVYFLQPLQKCS